MYVTTADPKKTNHWVLPLAALFLVLGVGVVGVGGFYFLSIKLAEAQNRSAAVEVRLAAMQQDIHSVQEQNSALITKLDALSSETIALRRKNEELELKQSTTVTPGTALFRWSDQQPVILSGAMPAPLPGQTPALLPPTVTARRLTQLDLAKTGLIQDFNGFITPELLQDVPVPPPAAGTPGAGKQAPKDKNEAF